ncbi:MAG: hypothetical protein QOD57_2691 [Actinomycetota bacterium]|nr:hypothetical protein [Actinomycetota bacterium]
MNPNDTLPPVQSSAAEAGEPGDLWPANGPAKGLRIRLPIAVAVVAVVGLVGAAGGAALKHPSSTTTQAGAIANNRANGATGANGGAGRLGGAGGGVVGTVTKVDGNTITVTQRDGTTATVVVPSGTAVSKTVSGSLADVAAGTSIAVRGTTANGKTTAQNITINPANGAGGFAGGGFGGGNAPNGTRTAPNG